MMRKSILALTIGLTLFTACKKSDPDKPEPTPPIQQTEPWSKNYGGTEADIFYSAAATEDGGFMIAGATYSTDGDVTDKTRLGFDAWVVKIDKQGTKQWQKTYGGRGNDFIFSIIASGDGNYLLAGATNSADGDVTRQQGSDDVWIVKIDKDGKIMWQKTYGGRHSDYATSIVGAKGGGFVVQGVSGSDDGDVSNNLAGVFALYDCWTFKIDPNGNMVWNKNYGSSYLDMGMNIISVDGGGYLISGWAGKNDLDATGGHGGDDALIVKIDENGNKVWSKVYGGTAHDGFHTAVQAKDGGFVLGGFTQSNNGDVTSNKGMSDYWVMKVDGSGNKVWQKTFGGSELEEVKSIVATLDGGYLVLGSTLSNNGDVVANNGGFDAWVIKLDGNGNNIWSKNIGAASSENARFLLKEGDKDYILVGDFRSIKGGFPIDYGDQDGFALKFKLP